MAGEKRSVGHGLCLATRGKKGLHEFCHLASAAKKPAAFVMFMPWPCPAHHPDKGPKRVTEGALAGGLGADFGAGEP